MLEIGGQHGREIAVIKPFEERCALVIDIFLLAYQRSVHKHAALLFVGKGALGHEALDEACFQMIFMTSNSASEIWGKDFMADSS